MILKTENNFFSKTNNRHHKKTEVGKKPEQNIYAKTFNEKAEFSKKRDEFITPSKEDSINNNTKPSQEKIYDKNIINTNLSIEEYHKKAEEMEEKAETMDVMSKCLRIALKIMRGDNVPSKDDSFLFKNYPKLHLQAWSFRETKEDPENCKSEIEEEGQELKVSFDSNTDIASEVFIESLQES